MVLMGLGYSLFVPALWTMIPMVVKPKILGSGYGISFAILNTGLALAPLVVGTLTIKSKGVNQYFWVSIFLVCTSALAFISSVALLLSDKFYNNSNLQKPHSQTYEGKGCGTESEKETMLAESIP